MARRSMSPTARASGAHPLGSARHRISRSWSCAPRKLPRVPRDGSHSWIADLHIHSKYSRACSRDLELPNLAYWARRRGIRLLGTGDVTHPAWLAHLHESL